MRVPCLRADTDRSVRRHRFAVHHLVADRARTAPTSPAVVRRPETMSYGELDRRADALARRLLDLGAGPEEVVALYLDRSVELVVGMLGILKAGAAYLPIEPGGPYDRRAYMLQDAGVALVVTREGLASDAGLSAPRRHLVLVGTGGADENVPATSSTGTREGLERAANLAYVIYTSGSTGRPKGVQLTHAGLANMVAWYRGALDIGPSDRTTQVAALGFDAVVWEVWPYLAAGASIHLPDEATRATPRRLLEWMVERRITVSFLPTPLAEILMEEQWPPSTALRLLLIGGDKLQRLPRPGLPFTVVNAYGPTENTVVATWHPMASAADAPTSTPSIGQPVDNVQVHVLDRDWRPVPMGVSGELFIGGVGLARAYVGRPDLTAERFVPSPFSAADTGALDACRSPDGGRLYRTGDLVRLGEDGNLVFLGRMDSQVKIRGFRIELDEIESVLVQHPAVRSAVVTVREDDGRPRLTAYAVPVRGRVPDATDVRRYLGDRLPDYMLPSGFVFLDALPLTDNGKVDRRALPAPVAPDAAGQADAGVPSQDDDMLAAMCAAWESVLQLRSRRGLPVAPGDDFVELGGDSIQAMQLTLALNAKGIGVDAGDILRHRTVRELRKHVATDNEMTTCCDEESA
jgi:amino acid adenylation domain-containing protein